MSIETLESSISEKMDKALASYEVSLSKIRTGRASPALVDALEVDYYGTPTPLNQMATIGAPEARLLTIQPWDQSALTIIEKALQTSNLGVTPQNDGKIIRIPLPPLTEERRKEYVKMANKEAEDARIAVRNIRRSGMEDLKTMLKDKEISEDENKKAQDDLQTLTDDTIKKVDVLFEKKSEEILEI